MLMIVVRSMTLASISGASERESLCKEQGKISDFFLGIVHFLFFLIGIRFMQG